MLLHVVSQRVAFGIVLLPGSVMNVILFFSAISFPIIIKGKKPKPLKAFLSDNLCSGGIEFNLNIESVASSRNCVANKHTSQNVYAQCCSDLSDSSTVALFGSGE